MKEKIKEIITDPDKLEKLYRDDKKSFEADFREIYPEIQDSEATKFWKSRLDFEVPQNKPVKMFGPDLYIMIAVCIFGGFLIKIPDLFDIDPNTFLFYQKDAGIIVFLMLAIYSISIKGNFLRRNLIITFAAFAVSAVFINLLPDCKGCSSVNLVYIHMPILMWYIYGLVYTDFDLMSLNKRIEYIRHNGDLAVMGALLVISGGILAMITFGLFQAIGIRIDKFYTNYVILIGAVSAPVLTTFILKNYSTLINRIATIIANIFSPLVLITLLFYLAAIVLSGKDPLNDRDFLLIFNIMLIGVMGIIVFSVSETSFAGKQKIHEIVLLILSTVTIIVNLVALSAIFYRLGEFGLSPNRLAVVGSNLLIFFNLILITIDLLKIVFLKTDLEKVALTIAKFLPVYLVWILIVIFVFPFVFGMR
jgi:hypothetical protein